MTYKSNEYSTGLFNWRFVEARRRWQDYLQPPHTKHSIVIDASESYFTTTKEIQTKTNPQANAEPDPAANADADENDQEVSFDATKTNDESQFKKSSLDSTSLNFKTLRKTEIHYTNLTLRM